MARTPRTVKQVAAPAPVAPNEPGADMDRIAQIIAFVVAKRGFTKDDPMIEQVATAAGPKGLPIEDVEAMLTDAGLSPEDPSTRATYSSLRVALGIGQRLLTFVDHAETAKAGDADISSSARAWALKMGRVALEHRGLRDEQVIAHGDAVPSYKSAAERAESRIKQALTLLEKAGDLMALSEKDGAKWTAIMAKIEGFQPEIAEDAA